MAIRQANLQFYQEFPAHSPTKRTCSGFDVLLVLLALCLQKENLLASVG